MKLDNKTAFITGGNSGIGLATAKLFIEEGARVVITGRNEHSLAEARKLGPNLLAIQADMNDISAIERAIGCAVEAFGRLDVVFANAGIGGPTPVGSTTLDTFESIVRTNLTAVFFTVQAASAYLNPSASVILNGSVHAVMGVPEWSAYAATKGAIRAMTRVLASELAPRGIRVNQVTPGAARTSIWTAVAPTEQALASLEQQIVKTIPLGRIGEAQEVAQAVLFLASKDSSNTVGAEIVVDGGATGAPMGAPAYRQPL